MNRISSTQRAVHQLSSRTRRISLVLATVRGYLASVRVGTEPKAPVRVRNLQATRPSDSWRAKAGPVPVKLWVSPSVARPIGSNLQFCVSGFTFMVAFPYATDNRKILILVCHSFFFNALAAVVIKMNRHTCPTTSWQWASTERQRLLVMYLG